MRKRGYAYKQVVLSGIRLAPPKDDNLLNCCEVPVPLACKLTEEARRGPRNCPAPRNRAHLEAQCSPDSVQLGSR